MSAQVRAEEAFITRCGSNGTAASRPRHPHCRAMLPVLRSYAAFHARAFAPETRCDERRVLVVRESYRDVVGMGHIRMGLHRFLAVAIALGRALVYSTCDAPDDRWAVSGHTLFKDSVPYSCATPHLNLADFYEGWGGIDLRWTPERRETLRRCNISELSVNTNARSYAQAQRFSAASLRRPCKPGWVGCRNGWSNDQMDCDVRAKAGCPDLQRLFGPGPTGNALAAAPLLALYNARRDAGFFEAPRWQLTLGNGDGAVAAPNGSTLGIATDEHLRDSLTCYYRCWAYASFVPAPRVRRLISTVLERLPPARPLVCAHLRTMWVDDHRCFPNPRGCHKVEYRRLTYWNTSRSISHSGSNEKTVKARRRRATAALDGRVGPTHHSLTEGRTSPLWWQLEVEHPLPFCRVVLHAGKLSTAVRKMTSRGSAKAQWASKALAKDPPMPLANISLALFDEAGALLWRSPVYNPHNVLRSPQRLELTVPKPLWAKSLRVERAFDEAQYAAPANYASMSFNQVEVFTDEPLSWKSVDSFVVPRVCRLLGWRGECPGMGPPRGQWRPEINPTVMPRLGGWSGLVRCMRTPEFALRLAGFTSGGRDALATLPMRWPSRTAAAKVLAQPGTLYLSTDSPALQELALETFPDSYVTIEGAPVPSWDEGLREVDYAKVIADFEMLKLCDYIAGPISSRYARTATEESMQTPKYTNSPGFCAWAGSAKIPTSIPASRRCVPINASGPIRLGIDD